MLRLITFGGLRIEPNGTAAEFRLRRPWLAVLAVLAAAGPHGVSRERLVALFWPDSDEDHARQSARQVLYGLRQALGHDVIVSSGAMLRLEESTLSSDLVEFRAALHDGDRARAVGLARAPFLDAFYLPGAAAFERWAEEERARIETARTSALRSLAVEAMRSGQRDAAVEWWRELTLADPLSGRFAVGYLNALAARGDRTEALAFARRHEAVLRQELETDPDPDVRRLVTELRAISSRGSAPFSGVSSTPALATRGAKEMTPESDRSASPMTTVSPPATLPARRWRAWVFAPVLLIAITVVGMRFGWPHTTEALPTIAVGFIRDVGVPDTTRLGGVLTDMLATNLARVEGLRLLANSRVIELMRAGADSSAGYADAARRAGATRLLEGHVIADSARGFALEMREVDLHTGVVQETYRVVAANRHRLVDSLTAAVARAFRLRPPASSVAAATTPSGVAYRFYEQGLRAYFDHDLKLARHLMRAALDEDSLFAMAAFYEAVLAAQTGDFTPDGRHATVARRAALALADRAPDRERLLITATLLTDDMAPSAVAVAETLATRYPDDPQAMAMLGRIRATIGNWAGAVASLERAIALDSAAQPVGSKTCLACSHYKQLGETYLWWDSLGAAERTAQRYLRARPDDHGALRLLITAAMWRGDSAATYRWFRQLLVGGGSDRTWKLALDLRLEEWEEFDRGVPQLLASSSAHDWGNGAWLLLISLRTQGRMREAAQFHRTGHLPGLPPLTVDRHPDPYNAGILSLERGDARGAARAFRSAGDPDLTMWSPGQVARRLAWHGTLAGMALASSGDTAAVHAMADSVEAWGRGSVYGRDRKAHHYLRGMLHSTTGRHESAIAEFRAAIHSTSLGFTRVNYEMARCLLHVGRPRDAIAILQPALRGEIDASNLYVTRTELHERLAESFDRAGLRDSAAVHHRAVVKAWRSADPAFHARRDKSTAWLAAYSGRAIS